MHIPEKLKHIFTIIITVLISVALTLLVVLFTVEHLTGRYIASFINTSLPEIIERKIETKKVSITLLTGSLTFKNLSVSSIKFLSNNIELSCPKIKIRIDLPELLNNRLIIKKLFIHKPKLQIIKPQAVKAGQIDTDVLIPPFLEDVQLRRVIVKGANIFTTLDEDIIFKIIGDIGIRIQHVTGIGDYNQPILSISANGKIPSIKKGKIIADLKFLLNSPKLNFEGAVKGKNISIPYFYSAFNKSKDTTIEGGVVDLKSTLHCSDNWLTASNIVTVDELDIKTTQKKLYGLKTKLITEFFKNNKVSFDLPINGDINAPKFGFGTAMTHVLMKALQEKFRNESIIRKISDKYGRKIGGKIESSLIDLFFKKS